MCLSAAAAPAWAECDQDSLECEVSSVVIDESAGSQGKGGKGSSSKPKYPLCNEISKGQPDDGSEVPVGWVRVTCMEGQLPIVFWVPPGRSANPALIARQLLDRVQLRPIRIGLTPLGQDPIALVGLPVWLWVEQPTRTTWGPATISAGGVTLTARVESVTWEMGDRDHTRLVCGKGTVWRRGMGGDPSPTCGFTYLDHGTYTVRATSHWVARWSGYGRSGVIRLWASTSRQLRVGEIQAIETHRG